MDLVYFSEFIRPACLQTYLKDESPNVELAIVGWGIVSPQCKFKSLIKTKKTYSNFNNKIVSFVK